MQHERTVMLKMAHKYIFLSKDDVSIRMRTMIWHKTTTLYSCRVQPRVFPENTLVTGLCFFFFYPALKEHDWQIVTHQPFKRGENIHIYLHFIYTYIYTHIYRYTHTQKYKNTFWGTHSQDEEWFDVQIFWSAVQITAVEMEFSGPTHLSCTGKNR